MQSHIDGCSGSFPECSGPPVDCLKKVPLTFKMGSLLGTDVFVLALEELIRLGERKKKKLKLFNWPEYAALRLQLSVPAEAFG